MLDQVDHKQHTLLFTHMFVIFQHSSCAEKQWFPMLQHDIRTHRSNILINNCCNNKLDFHLLAAPRRNLLFPR